MDDLMLALLRDLHVESGVPLRVLSRGFVVLDRGGSVREALDAIEHAPADAPAMYDLLLLEAQLARLELGVRINAVDVKLLENERRLLP